MADKKRLTEEELEEEAQFWLEDGEIEGNWHPDYLGLAIPTITLAALAVVSISYDYGACVFPSRITPFLFSGRLILGRLNATVHMAKTNGTNLVTGKIYTSLVVGPSRLDYTGRPVRSKERTAPESDIEPPRHQEHQAKAEHLRPDPLCVFVPWW